MRLLPREASGARYCQGKLSVRLSVRPSITLRYRDHIRFLLAHGVQLYTTTVL